MELSNIVFIRSAEKKIGWRIVEKRSILKDGKTYEVFKLDLPDGSECFVYPRDVCGIDELGINILADMIENGEGKFVSWE